MPVTLAMAAIDRSISAQRITKVRLAAAKKPNRQISVRNGAMLRICERNIAAIPRGRFRSAGTVTLSPEVMPVSSRRFQEAVLADLFVGKLPHDSAALE